MEQYNTDDNLTQSQKDLQTWIKSHLNEEVTPFFPSLVSGVLLCKLLKIFNPSIKNPDLRKGKFIERENVEVFIEGCRELGIDESYLFTTIDLNELKNPKQVEKSLYMLSMKLKGTYGDEFNGIKFLGPAVKKEKEIVFKKVKKDARLGFWEGNTN